MGLYLLDPLQIHIHILEMTPSFLSESHEFYLDDLSKEERQNYQNLDLEVKRKEFLLSRLLVRRLGSHYLGIDRSDLITACTEKGKPFIPNSRLQFNLSHTTDLIACSFGYFPVGIDVEKVISWKFDRHSFVVRRFFSEQEQSYLMESPTCDRAGIFHRIFTLKEARVKALGEGLGRDLSKSSIPFPLVEGFHQDGWDHQSWILEKGNHCLAQVTANPDRKTLEFVTYRWTEAEFLASYKDPLMSGPRSSDRLGIPAAQGKMVR